jgi:hypothetical protein
MTREKRQIQKHIAAIFGCRKTLDERANANFHPVPLIGVPEKA